MDSTGINLDDFPPELLDQLSKRKKRKDHGEIHHMVVAFLETIDSNQFFTTDDILIWAWKQSKKVFSRQTVVRELRLLTEVGLKIYSCK